MAPDEQLDVEGQRFAIVPEWVIDLPVGDAAFRLYAVLLRYGGSSGSRMPSRRTLATRLGKSVDTIDRAMRELEAAGAVTVERRTQGPQRLTNRYHLRTSGPGRTDAATPLAEVPGSRTGAARGGRADAARGGRNSAAQVAAPVRPYPEHFTESTPTELEELARLVRDQRVAAGLPLRGWGADAVRRARERALERHWPEQRLASAVLAVAIDPVSRSPLRVAEDGPWWDNSTVSAPADGGRVLDVAACEALLDELDGDRLKFQREARAELTREGEKLTRSSVLLRTVQLAGLSPTRGRPAHSSVVDQQASPVQATDVAVGA